jgi:RNA polymerase sigma-70 factor (ECF subfamily)
VRHLFRYEGLATLPTLDFLTKHLPKRENPCILLVRIAGKLPGEGSVNESDTTTVQLLERVAAGSDSAVSQLLINHRPQLRRMISARLDTRLASRLDPSDVVQDVLAEAHRRLASFLEERPLPFHLWLRRLALDQLSALHREHIVAQRRSVVRETYPQLSDDSIAQLADGLVAISPSRALLRNELCRQVQQALDELSETDRELLIMKYVEELSLSDIAAVSQISLAAAKSRHLRALSRLGVKIGRLGGGR